MTFDIKAAVQAAKDYQEYNKKAVKAIASSNSEEELNKNLENVGAFDFQKGSSYSKGLTSLAVGILLEQDKNGDGYIDLEEHKASGLELYKDIFDKDTLKQMSESEDIAIEFYARDVDIDDKNGLDELMLLISLADKSLDSEDFKRIKDGQFTQEDLAQAQETLLKIIMEENPQLEDELQARMSEIYKHLGVSSLLTDYDYDQNNEISKEELVTFKVNKADEENKVEAKAGAYVMFELMDGFIGDGNGTLTENELYAFAEYANAKGMSVDTYYDYLLEQNFISEDGGNHAFYEDVLNAYKNN